MSTIEIVMYSKEYREALKEVLIKFSQELFGAGTVRIDEFIDYHWCVYLAMKDGKVIGFTSFTFNTYYGLRPPTVGNDYNYVLPEYRGGRAMYLLSIQAGMVSVENNLPLEHYYASEATRKLSRKMTGVKAYEAYIYDVEEVRRIYIKLLTKVKFKD